MKDFINLRGQRFRVEITIGAMERLLNAKNVNSIEGLENLKDLTFTDTYMLIYYCLEEGASWDKKKLPFTLDEISMWMRPVDVHEFMSIFHKQSSIDAGVQKKSKINQILQRLSSIFSWRQP